MNHKHLCSWYITFHQAVIYRKALSIYCKLKCMCFICSRISNINNVGCKGWKKKSSGTNNIFFLFTYLNSQLTLAWEVWGINGKKLLVLPEDLFHILDQSLLMLVIWLILFLWACFYLIFLNKKNCMKIVSYFK